MIGRWQALAIDCADPSGLAGFYEALLGYRRIHDEPGWVVIGPDGGGPAIAFQRVPDHRPPTWPSSARSSQMHVDVLVDDLARAEASVLDLGATLLEGGERFHVYADPAGHPFCLAEWLPSVVPPRPGSSASD
ncbi:VOC family protein [Pseudonocardia sp. KRD291]|uniref:VOC family protein n=1 Tax=Pseudonocardia sp. KRD291 TaxID=2792007 RepID=UPI001C49D25A|nr:VOC family protein [Pseudonocardia sp. KRD291]MBW0103630.1 VOC family protein [Pseudonocardia sp. KRD291]